MFHRFFPFPNSVFFGSLRLRHYYYFKLDEHNKKCVDCLMNSLKLTKFLNNLEKKNLNTKKKSYPVVKVSGEKISALILFLKFFTIIFIWLLVNIKIKIIRSILIRCNLKIKMDFVISLRRLSSLWQNIWEDRIKGYFELSAKRLYGFYFISLYSL